MESLRTVLSPRRGFIIFSAFLVGILAAGVPLLLHASKVKPLKYSASVQLLITQRASFTLDPYTAIRSTELIADHLAQVVGTSSFLKNVLESGYRIDTQYFAGTEQRRRRLWARTVDASPVRGTGLLRVAVFHPSREEAVRIVSAVSFLLSNQGGQYLGRDITVLLVDPPLASRYPTQPNLILNGVAGVAVGAVLSAGWVWVDHRRRKHRGQLVG